METTFAKARRLRREMTPFERDLWRVLRGRGLGGFKFRRQVPVGPFIVDFLCVEAGLVVEIDGDSHSGQLAYDRRRTLYLETQGFKVIRITNQQVSESLEGSLHVISSSLPKYPLTPAFASAGLTSHPKRGEGLERVAPTQGAALKGGEGLERVTPILGAAPKRGEGLERVTPIQGPSPS